MSWVHFLPLFAGFVYALAAMFLKRALANGAGAMRLTFISNWMAFFACTPFFFFLEGQKVDWSHWWAPLICSVCVLLGWVSTLCAIRFGEVSLQSPLMSIKVILVALFTLLMLPGAIPLAWWISGGLIVCAMFLMSKTDGSVMHRKTVLLTFALCLCSATLFGVCDVLIEKESPYFGEMYFLLLMAGATAVESCLLIPFFRGSLFDIPKSAVPWVLWGTALMGGEAALLYMAICFFGQAAVVNILYSSRGLWSVFLVGVIGHWLVKEEYSLGRNILIRRFIGAFLLCVAIGLVMTD